MSDNFRIEKDSLGEIKVPADALYAAQTQRAHENFPISGLTLPRTFIRALGLIKASAAEVNLALGQLDERRANAIQEAAMEVANGDHDAHFPVDIFQTGSGTSSNMNTNEVVATRASQLLGEAGAVHPNDHVNMGQSSNDIIPTAIHVSACLEAHNVTLPGLTHLSETLARKAEALDGVVKTGRTHLMDAMPVRMSQEIGGWKAQIDAGIERIKSALTRVSLLAQGGTAVGTGINAHPEFGARMAAAIGARAGIDFAPSPDYFMSLSSQDAAVELSGQLKTVAVSMMKIANDLRWMNSGPIAGFGEISLPSLQPGSSIMPGKINPVIPEAACMVAAQVIGNDATITVAGQAGNFQLNVMLPVIGYNLLQSLTILGTMGRSLADSAIEGYTANEEVTSGLVGKNPILVTALNPVIGYELGAKIAKTAYAQRRPLKEVALEMTDLSEAQLDEILDPAKLTQGGITK